MIKISMDKRCHTDKMIHLTNEFNGMMIKI